MEVVDDEDVETMVALYCGNGSDKNALIHLFAELVGMEQNEDVNASDEEHGAQEPWMVALISYVDSESTMGGIGIDLNITPDIDVDGGEKEGGSYHWDEEVNSDGDPDVDDVPDDIDDEDVNNDRNINASSVREQMRCILIHNNPGPHMSLIDPDAAYVAEFPEYLEIVHPHGLVWIIKSQCLLRQYILESVGRQRKAAIGGSVYCIRHIAASFHKDYKNADWKRQVVAMAYELEPHIFCQRMIRLESDMEGQTNTSFRQWLGTIEPWQCAQSFDEGFRYGQMTTNLVEGINAVLLKTHHLPIASVFSTTFYRLATLMPRMGQQQVDQMEAGHVFVEHVRDAMVANRRMARPSVIYLVYQLGPIELTSGTDSASARGSTHFIIHVRMSWQRVLKSTLMLNNMPMMCTCSRAHCVSRKMSSPSCLTYLCGRCLRQLSSLSQTEGYGGIQEVVRNQAESVMKWTLGRNPTESVVDYVG
ncbi:hypothetical protein GOBAR_DD26733 [Gossypium barbadense]|nr:hypothetical protein GOBAR_DD26733 [Gossypium barbadense]